MNNRGYANMMLGNEGLSCFIRTVEVPLPLLLAVCALPAGPAFETLNEDLLLTGRTGRVASVAQKTCPCSQMC